MIIALASYVMISITQSYIFYDEVFMNVKLCFPTHLPPHPMNVQAAQPKHVLLPLTFGKDHGLHIYTKLVVAAVAEAEVMCSINVVSF